VGVELARASGASPEDALLGAVRALDAKAAAGLVARADGDAPRPARPGAAPWAKALAKLEPGEVAPVPAWAIRPGQAQLSFDHAGEKMAKIAAEILEEKPDSLADLFDADDFPVVVAPDGAFALLRDGHHKLAGLLALSALVHDLLGTNGDASSRTAPAVGGAWKKLAKVLPPPSELDVPALVEANEAELAPKAKAKTRIDDFFSLFDAPGRYRPPLHLTHRDGSVASVPPERMSDLEDSPFRRLAAELLAKLSWRDDGTPKLKKDDAPLWLKGPDAPEYVEFEIAEILERASAEIDFSYTPGEPVPEDVQDAFRQAMIEARRSGHPVLQKIVSFEHDIDLEALGATFALTSHAALDFDAKRKPDPDEIPVVLLPEDAPDVHRLHVAARLHAALTEAGAELDADALDPDIARATIARLEHVHDDIGLWVNEARLTMDALERDAELAKGLAVKVKPKKKTKLKLAEAPESSAPVWVDVPGLPPSAAHAVAAECSDLFARIDHDPARLHEVADEARSRLIAAKTTPDHPAYDRLAQVPVVVAGDAEAVAASLRAGRKHQTLEVGRPVEGAEPPPHVLAPRRQLAVER
jgi:hypothetical protein